MAVTEAFRLGVSVQVGREPRQPPLQPAKRASRLGVARKTSLVPESTTALQAGGQLITAVRLSTVPPTPPAIRTRTRTAEAKRAVTLFAASICTRHGPSPAHAPDQPRNVVPGPAVAVSVTDVPPSQLATHWGGHT